MFIEVSDGIFVEKDKIEAIESVSQTKSVIYTASRTYKVTLPVEALRQILESKDETSERLLKQLVSSTQTNRS